ncbi:hypothetical protein E7T06_18380 [Deinococcus sp. Arct2-2]|uniref:hypothetical protein n=1 Tax=Deinococcus sp. Arct2-2 TaxID=2568653 RepID=UPI0010A303FD|nr:hypothetical protein [Deinococcus sp. Arct2-2]THF68007.1 hypothetical protein E7T06_18380 [Deinococcus sp. Arct2-2]
MAASGLEVPTGYSSSTDVVFSYSPSFAWLLLATGVLLLLAFVFRRKLWARRVLLTLAGLCFVGAWLL